MKMEAQAQGMREMMTKQAEGFAEIVKAAGGASDDAVRMMIADKLEELMKIQVDAIRAVLRGKPSKAAAESYNKLVEFLLGDKAKDYIGRI